MLAMAHVLARLWTWIYTSGMPAALRDARRDEIASDLWESAHDRDSPHDLAAALRVIVRLFRGIPDDFLWRGELMDLRTRRRPAALLTLGVTLLAAALWIRALAAPPTLPDLPRSPVMIQTWLMRVPPPPPPPPPPPGYDRRLPPYHPQGRDVTPPVSPPPPRHQGLRP
jgi:hypothetical protein